MAAKKSSVSEVSTSSQTSSETAVELPTVVRVSRTVKIDGEDEASDLETEEIIEVRRFVTQPAICRFGFPIKRSIDYQSVGLEISVDLPCYVEEIEHGFVRAKDIVVATMQAHIGEMNRVLDHIVELKRQDSNR